MGVGAGVVWLAMGAGGLSSELSAGVEIPEDRGVDEVECEVLNILYFLSSWKLMGIWNHVKI